MPTPKELAATVEAQLKDAKIEYEAYTHEPVLNYETSAKVIKEHGIIGSDSKSLFLRGKDNNYYMFVTLQGTRLDMKLAKKIVGVKLSIASDQELIEQTGYVPGCAGPFGLSTNVRLLIDSAIYEVDYFLCSPGLPERSIKISGKALRQVIEATGNKKYYYS